MINKQTRGSEVLLHFKNYQGSGSMQEDKDQGTDKGN